VSINFVDQANVLKTTLCRHQSTNSHWLLSSAGVLHWSTIPHIRHQNSTVCPHCNDAEETAEHLTLQRPTHGKIRQMWPDHQISSDPRRLWSLKRLKVLSSTFTYHYLQRTWPGAACNLKWCTDRQWH